MATQNSKNFVTSLLDAQKQMVDNLVESSKKMTNGNNLMSDTLEKGTEAYNKWVEDQKTAFSDVAQKAEDIAGTAKEKISKATAYNQDWLNNQVNWTKQAWEMNQNFIKNNVPNAETWNNAKPADWFNQMTNQWTNFTNNYNSWMNQANQANQWMEMMKQYQPAQFADTMKSATENWTGLFNQYNDLLKNSFAGLQKNMQDATAKDAYTNMMDMASGFGKFAEMWAPFWKSIQDKTFNAEQFKAAFNMGSYKELTDKFFGFMPEQGRQYVQQATEWMNNGMKSVTDMGKANFTNGRDLYNSLNPFQGVNMFQNLTSAYQQFHNTLQESVAPIAKMVTPNQFTKATEEWAAIADRMAIFSIKNAEMQYMVYQQSNKVLDQLVENISNKIENGTEINSITALYQEWLNLGDKVYVELFESDEYSKIMAEVSALQLKLRKDIDLQTEKMMGGLPVATKSELDELYKIIYDLKKEVRQLEKMMEIEDQPKTAAEPKATAKKTTTTKK